MEKSQEPSSRHKRMLVTAQRIAALATVTTVLGAALVALSIRSARAYPGAEDTARVFWSSMLGALLFLGGICLIMAAWMFRGYRWHMGCTEKGGWQWVLK